MEGVERIEKLLALMLMHEMQDATPADRALTLSRAGFSPSEIGSLLGSRANTISVQLSRANSVKKKTPRSRALGATAKSKRQ